MISAPYLYRVLYLKAVANSRAQYQHQLKIEVSRPPLISATIFFAIAFFLRKGCQVVKTPINTRDATSKRLSEVVKRLSAYYSRKIFLCLRRYANLRELYVNIRKCFAKKN